MEPLATQAAGLAGTRPVLALAGDLSAVLQEGRLVAGEVLQRLDGGSILIGLGRHRVPAQSQVELAPGERFVARVEVGAEGTRLRLEGPRGGAAEPALLAALRSAVGSERPLGELLGELAARLRAASDPSSQGLARELEGHLVRPGAGAAELRALVARAGHGYEALLLAGLRGRDPRAAAELAEELAAHVRRLLLERSGLASEPAAVARTRQVGQDLEEALARALVRALAAGTARSELLGALRGVFQEALGAFPEPERASLRAVLEEAARALLREPAGDALARRALGFAPREGSLGPAAEELAERLAAELLRRVEGREPPAARLAILARSLGPPLARALGEALEAARSSAAPEPRPPLPGALPAPPPTAAPAALLEALGRVLPRVLESLPEALRAGAASEPTELLRAVFSGPAGESLARRLALLAGSGRADPLAAAPGDLKAGLLAALEFLPEGPIRAALARALAGLEAEQLLNLARRELGEGVHLALPLAEGGRWTTLHLFRHPRPPGSLGAGEAPLERVGLALELSRLGAVRAELGWRPGALRVRVTVADERVRELLRAAAGPLRERLGAAGEAVELSFAVAQAAELELDRLALDVGYLRQHQLLDLSA